MRVFVTGATGVIGRRVVPLLLAQHHQVTALARSAAKRSHLAQVGATPIAADLFDPDALRTAVRGHDAIVNLATHMPPSTARMLFPGAWKENDRIRRIGSANLVNAVLAGSVGRFVQESFAPIYEDHGDEWITESWPMRPARYNRTTLDAERSAAGVTAAGGAGVALRFGGFYGPDAFTMKDMIEMTRKGWIPVPGSPDAFLSMVTHDDVAAAVVAALTVPAGAYNVTDDEPMRRGELFATLAKLVGAEPPKPLPRWVVPLMGSIGECLSRSPRISNRKLKEASGWAPRCRSAREGLRATLEEMAAAGESAA